MRKFVQVMAVGTATALALAGCSGSDPDATEKTTLKLNNSTDITSWDPSAIKEGSVIQYEEAVYDSLLKKTSDAEIEENLATEWDYNSDLTELDITLREGIKFSDGSAFDAKAVKANLEDRKSGAGTASETAKGFKKVEVVSPTEVKLILSSPDPGLLAQLATYTGFMASPKAIKDGSIDKSPIGTGPYVLDKKNTESGTKYAFTKKSDYWDEGAYPFESVEMKPIDDFTAAFNALSTGQTDFMYATPDMADKAESSGLTVQTVPGEWQGIILQDRAGKQVPALGEPEARQAINLALDKEAILAGYFQGFGQVSSQIFNPSGEAWVKDLNDEYPYDPEEAKKKLAEAGYPDGFTLPIVYSSGTIEALLPILKQYLGEVGIKVKPELAPSFANGGLKVYNDSAAFVLSFSTNIPAWTDVTSEVTKDAPWNGLKYTDSTVNRLVKEIPKTAGAKQKELYQELNTHIVRDAWFAPIASLENVYLSSPDIKVTTQEGQLVPSLRFFAAAK